MRRPATPAMQYRFKKDDLPADIEEWDGYEDAAVEEEPEPDEGMTLESAFLLVNLAQAENGGRKFTPDDVAGNDELYRAACKYARDYDDDFDFMLDMRDALAEWGKLTPGQAKGVLNCMLAELRRRARQEDIAAKVEQHKAKGEPVERVVPNGTYTVDGLPDGARVTLRLFDDFRKDVPEGTQAAAFLFGADNESDYLPFAFVQSKEISVWKRYKDGYQNQQAALAVLLGSADPLKYGEAYALASGRCFRCARTLTVPTSLHRGLGPECAKQITG